MLQVRENEIPLRKWSGAQLESGRVFRVGFGLTISMFRAEFGFIFCSSRNVLRISLEEIGKSGQKRVFISLVGFGSGFGQQGSGSGRVEKSRPDSNSGLVVLRTLQGTLVGGPSEVDPMFTVSRKRF